MSRGSFGRTVARAAASGGSRSYRARRPAGWYLLLAAIVISGSGLIAYSRNEVLHPKKKAATAATGPTSSSNWNAAFAIDICGTIEPNLPANSNLSAVGLRTFGDGLININPGAVKNSTAFAGPNATLDVFFSGYPRLTVTKTSIVLPGPPQQTWKNGDRCASKSAGQSGVGELQVRTWSSASAKKSTLTTDPSSVHLTNGELVTLAFVPKGASIPKPPATTLAALRSVLGTGSTPASKKK